MFGLAVLHEDRYTCIRFCLVAVEALGVLNLLSLHLVLSSTLATVKDARCKVVKMHATRVHLISARILCFSGLLEEEDRNTSSSHYHASQNAGCYGLSTGPDALIR